MEVSMYNLQQLYDKVSNHPAVLEIGIENYVNSGISIGIDDVVDPSLVEQGLVTLQNNSHFAITQKGLNAVGLPTPDWDSFNAYMLSDPMFKTYRDTVRTADGELSSALFDAHGLVETNGVAAFSLVWGIWVSVSGITVADKETIATKAEGFNLPAEFVAVIRG